MIEIVTNPEVDSYVEASEQWAEEIAALRAILLRCGLTEELKWRKPCYSHDGGNIVIVQEMKRFLALMFFKGALLRDADEVLQAQGPNSRSARRLEFASVDDVHELAGTVEAYVAEAIEIERSGIEVEPPGELVLVAELQARLDQDAALKAAFEALTPGRQREYHLFVSGAKQSATREARVDKHVERILAGRGLRDR